MKKIIFSKTSYYSKLILIFSVMMGLIVTYENCGGKFDANGVKASLGGGDQSSNTPNSATLTWTAPTEDEKGNQLTDDLRYNVYYGTGMRITERIATNDGITKKPNISIQELPYVVSGLNSGARYCFVVTAVNSAGESAPTDPEECIYIQ
ncbi:MAG: hypothetical protein A2Z20_07315 [Bdellovibrionales bacterium RBG_16_40_8]|nr:MAG: hypothetical protein A2Z20_07315 [Bdellovibrionales bacterium RBG_16_40_8]